MDEVVQTVQPNQVPQQVRPGLLEFASSRNTENWIVKQFENGCETSGVKATSYGLQCVRESAVEIVRQIMASDSKSKVSNDPLFLETVRSAALMCGALELSPAHKEVYFSVRQKWTRQGNGPYYLEYSPYGDGYITIARKFGENVKSFGTVVYICGDDKWTPPAFIDGAWGRPSYVPVFGSKDKPAKAVWVPMYTQTGEVIDLYAEREEVKPNVLAFLRQPKKQAVPTDLMEKAAQAKTVDEIREIIPTNYWSPAYASNWEAMIRRKMLSKCIKQIRLNFSNDLQREAFVDMENDAPEMKAEIASAENSSTFAVSSPFDGKDGVQDGT